MAAREKLFLKPSIASSALIHELNKFLPKDITFQIYHLSTPPTRASALYSAPPEARPERTYCESHFLTVSIQTSPASDDTQSKEALVFAIEVLIYSTAYSSTFFVSKADSTGYLHLLKLPKGTPSPIRDISATFLRFIVEQRQRPNVQSIVSLFARAQDQYLFPGSIENSGKHVLDDRGLIKWWCRVLNPLVEDSDGRSQTSQWDTIKGYLVVPGLDSHETASYIPSKIKPPSEKSPWTTGHPLREISRNPDMPPRCLVPHFPDDPKSRYLDELDDEITKGRGDSCGRWKSVQSIDQFWEMMAFRQECSAGRLVGFIWIVFAPKSDTLPIGSVIGDSQSSALTVETDIWDNGDSASLVPLPNITATPNTSFAASSQPLPTSSPLKLSQTAIPESSQRTEPIPKRSPPKRKKLTGRIIPRQPRIKTKNKNYLLERVETTAYYAWRPEGRGQVIVEEADYKRITELLLRLDFANLDLAESSSRRWINEVRSSAWGDMSDSWGQSVTGTKVIEVRAQTGVAGVNNLTMGLVRRKRKPGAEPLDLPTSSAGDQPAAINILGAGMIRKKAKV